MDREGGAGRTAAFLSIFFDLRLVCGDLSLIEPLRLHIESAVRGTPAFLPHFARNALLFKPPLGLFGRILTGGSGGEHPACSI